MTVTGINGTTYNLDSAPIGSGGEGDIYSVRGMDYVAKIYKSGELSWELYAKLQIMIEHPPNASVLSQVAWPLDLIHKDSGPYIGFIMPKLSINAELGEIYKYPSALPLSAHQKINIAQNICAVISEVHKAGYIFGDFNPRNIGLDTNTGLVSFLDTDTYHVVDQSSGETHRCNVCAPGYAAPELLEKCSDYIAENPMASKNAYAQTPLPTFTKDTDNFALAIHVFKLLMNGYTPFGGIIETASVSQSSPGVGDAAVRRDSYCFKPGYKHQSAAIMPLDALPQEIADLFSRAFIYGKINPVQRPDAAQWHGALTRYEQSLVTCHDNPLHQYDKKNNKCPLCEADRRYRTAVAGGVPAATSLKQSTYAPLPVSAQTQTAKTTVSATVQSPPVQPPSPAPLASNPHYWRNRIIGAVSFAVVAASILVASHYSNLNNTYAEAYRLLQSGHYMAAKEAFSNLGSHRDSEEMILESDYKYAHNFLNAGNFAEAIEVFSRIHFYNDSEVMITESYLQWWQTLLEYGNFTEAIEVLRQMPHDANVDLDWMIGETYYHQANHLLFNDGDFEGAKEVLALMQQYRDSEELMNEANYQHAMHLLNDGNYLEAKEILALVQQYRDSEELMNEANYQHALHLLDENNPQDAKTVLLSIRNFKDSHTLIQEIDYDTALALRNENQLLRSYVAFTNLANYRDSQVQREEIRHLMYLSGVEAYRDGDFNRAAEMFINTREVEDSANYLTLIQAHRGQWDGDGSGLLDLLDFEDTIAIINGNDILLQNFLGTYDVWGLGRRWSDADGNYILFYTQGDSSSWNQFIMPRPDGNYDYYEISDGIHYRYPSNAAREQWTPHWEYTILSLNRIRIHNFHDGKNYTLNRSR